MTVDPQDPDTFDEPARRTPGRPGVETPEADAAEQHTEVEQHDEEVTPRESRGAEVDPADAAEQARIVEENEDEYR